MSESIQLLPGWAIQVCSVRLQGTWCLHVLILSQSCTMTVSSLSSSKGIDVVIWNGTWVWTRRSSRRPGRVWVIVIIAIVFFCKISEEDSKRSWEVLSLVELEICNLHAVVSKGTWVVGEAKFGLTTTCLPKEINEANLVGSGSCNRPSMSCTLR